MQDLALSAKGENVVNAQSRPLPEPGVDARTGWLALAAALTALAAFRLVALALNGTDLHMDEAQYWDWAQQPAFGYFSKPPLLAWIIAATTAVCGDGEFCVRLPAVVLHLVTAALVYAVARRLYTPLVAMLSALAYALLPAVSLSSGIITTDIPLLAAWALALLAFTGLLERPNAPDAILLAIALGLGLNAKYAMAYFILCAAIYFAIAPAARKLLRTPHLWLALVAGLAMIAPNVLWNIDNGFVTFSHTADNAKWGGIPFHPGKAAEFFVAQFGVFGPIVFGSLLLVTWQMMRRPESRTSSDVLLASFSLPIIALVTTQGLISRAHANWAAPAYVAAIVLVTAVMVRNNAWGWLRASFAIHAVVALLIAAATWQAGRYTIPVVGDPFARTLGNRALAETVREEIQKAADGPAPIRAIVTDERETAAALAYYGRDIPLPQLAMRPRATPQNHFEMTRPLTPGGPEPVLYVTRRAKSVPEGHFRAVSAPSERSVRAGQQTESYRFFTLLATGNR